MPWYSVYGNHDYHSDPCICSDDVEACAQVNTGNLSHFEMPSYTYFKDLRRAATWRAHARGGRSAKLPCRSE